jgi:protoporphyrinogen oxidase
MMRDVVIVGGGLTGLAAAYELEQHNLPYTLIEVKNRLGGSIISERHNGFLIDGGAFAVERSADWSFLADLGLENALQPLTAKWAIFQDGTQSLVDALSAHLTGAKMLRMAVSSLGMAEDRFGVCLENGLMLDTRALIVTAPARYTDHMLFSLEPAIGQRLMGYHYDKVVRLSVGYHKDDFDLPPRIPTDMAFPVCNWTDHPSRVPPGHVLLQLGVRLPCAENLPADWINTVLEEARWPTNPVLAVGHYWPEADPLTCHDDDHAANMCAVDDLLPDGVALVGSDYGAFNLSERITQGRTAARQIANWLGSRN